MTLAFAPPKPPYANYSGVGKLKLSDYWTYFQAMQRNPLEVWGEHHFSIRLAPFRFLGRSNLLLNDPAAIHQCFVSDAGNFTMNPLRQAVLRPFLRDGLLTAEGDVWKTARKAVSPVFTPRKVNGFAPQIRDVCEAAVTQLADRAGETVSVSDLMVELTLDVLLETLFSGDEALDKARFTRGICDLLEISGIPHPFDLMHLPGWLPRIGQGKSRQVIRDLRDQVGAVAAARRAAPSPEAAGRTPDFLDLLLGAGLDDTAVIDNLLTFLAAGHETTARSLAWTLYLLSRDADSRDRVEAEIDAAPLADTDPAAWSGLLPFTEAVLKESLRLYPPAPMLTRTSKAWSLVAGLPVPAGTDILVSTWLLHRQRDIWQQPDEFRPDRFLGEAAAAIPRDAYLPFGLGPRVCIGARFAMMEMVIVMACLSKRLRLDFAGERDPVPVMRITLQPDTGMPMTVQPR
ncbi:cytochrome P450 [Maricaulis maris]|uniref:Cytochrome P450 n=1 Tax=Maricaulis maris TaxID=74318 RepID=A0A495DNP6_9PROT|nr:cytochrome P450 [Maricaulis maris]RKR03881.1 cytochrome P450 [Maricaulis maris]